MNLNFRTSKMGQFLINITRYCTYVYLPRIIYTFKFVEDQGDQIGRIFTQWAINFFGQFDKKWQK
jgi:hypothetical protein